MKKRKLIISSIIMAVILNLACLCKYQTLATEEITKITLSDESVKVNEKEISKDSKDDIYVSSSMDNGGKSENAQKANIEIENIINIKTSGIYEFSGTISDAQISIDANEILGEVIIILDNANITCKNAPAVFIYNTKNNSDTCKIIIKTKKGTSNTITGGKIKQSVENWEDKNEILYYIDKGYDDERNYYERYKYDGAISSDISLTFEGEGTLKVNSSEKEGIESKRDITINSGNYIINSLDDGINACTDKESIITINDGKILVNVLEDAEEGDGIDSNGYLYINGGTIYAFASEKSQDNGLDSDLGTYINGGTVVSTGNMSDEISKDSKQNLITLDFSNKISKQELITITDEKSNPIIAFEADRSYKILTISSENLKQEKYNIYKGGKISGTNENGLYTQITSYKKGTKQATNSSEIFEISVTNNSFRNVSDSTQKQDISKYVIIISTVLLIISIISTIIMKKKSNIIILVIGILIGIIITTISFSIYTKQNSQININQNNQREMPERPNDEGMQAGEMPNGMQKPNNNEMEPPEKPDSNKESN
jgi:uncharacterized membrane protein